MIEFEYIQYCRVCRLPLRHANVWSRECSRCHSPITSEHQRLLPWEETPTVREFTMAVGALISEYRDDPVALRDELETLMENTLIGQGYSVGVNLIREVDREIIGDGTPPTATLDPSDFVKDD